MKSWRYSKACPKGKIFESPELEGLGPEWVDSPAKLVKAEESDKPKGPAGYADVDAWMFEYIRPFESMEIGKEREQAMRRGLQEYSVAKLGHKQYGGLSVEKMAAKIRMEES